MKTHRTTGRNGDGKAALDETGTLIAEEKAGSSSVLVRHAPVTVQTAGKEGEEPKSKTYDSYQISYYEGTRRKLLRRNTPEKAKKRAKEIATRLSRLGHQADHLSEKDRRIYILARNTAQKIGLPVDEICRRCAELSGRLKEGALEQAVDFKNNHGQGV